MKEVLLSLAQYNIWANDRILGVLQSLTNEQLEQPVESSFPSIRATLQHMYGAEDIWLQRLQLVEHPIWKGSDESKPLFEVAESLRATSTSLLEIIEKAFDDRVFTHVFQYYDMHKQSYKMPVSECLLHIFNHDTYHRGQLVTMLRQLGINKIPSTDFITWQRTTSK
jgi:uncharacterized damage-inducible protein DinB